MRQFIGRQPQLQAFANRLGLAEGGLLRFTGQAGIGKSRLLREFRACCEKEGRPYLWLNLENATEIPDGMQILFELGRSAHGFPEARRAALRQQGESAGDALNRYDKTLDKLADAARLVDPSGGALTAIARTAVRLAQDIAGPRAGEDIDGAIENSEHYLLNILAAAGPHHPVCLLDTYEHLLASRHSFNSRVEFDGGKAREGIAREIKLAKWMRQLTDFLVANGWIVVIAGRYLIGERDEDRLPRLGRADIASAIDANPAFADWLPDHRETLLDLLTDLSFDGNPLWLSIAINLLERQLADGDTPERLRDDPGYLRRCFERTDPDDDLAALEGIEHSACKLHLLEHLTRDCPALEEQGWRIALPRVLDQGILRCLYPREQADALLYHYQLAGAFDEAGRNGYRLHEEIRDLLLAYARGKGHLQAPETRRLHCKILQYLFDRHNFDPDELLDTSLADLRQLQLQERYPDAENPWLLEATYHAVQVKSELQRHGVTNEAFWDHLGGSARFSGIQKLWVAIHPLEHAQVRYLIEEFRNEAVQLSKLLGSSSTQALREALRSGAAKHVYDLGFWLRRVDNFGLVGDHFGLAVTYAEVGSDEEAIAVYDKLLARFVDSDNPKIQTQCATAMVNKGVALSQLQRPKEAIAVYDTLLARFGDYDNPEIQTRCIRAMVDKGVTLSQLQRSEEAITVYNKLLTHFGDHDNPEIQTQCAMAMLNKGITLDQSQHPEEAIAVYHALFADFGDHVNPEIQTRCAMAMLNLGFTLGRLQRSTEAISVYDDLLVRFGDHDNPEIQEQCAKAMVNKGVTLGQLQRSAEAISVYDDLLVRFGDHDNPEIQEQCAKAMVNKGFRLSHLQRAEEAIAAFDALLARFGDHDDPEIQTQCQSARADSAELLLAAGQPDAALARIEQVLASAGRRDQKSAIMVFLRWLIRDDDPRRILAAIDVLEPGVEFTWGFSELADTIAALPPRRRVVARGCVDFFEGRIGREALGELVAGA